MSISEKFKKLCTDLRMSQTVVNNVSSRYKQITKRLNLDFYSNDSDTLHSLFVGSYGRGTAIHVSDIDILFILPISVYNQYNSYIGNGQSALLQAFKSSICRTYSTSYLGADGQVIKLNFSDGISFEIVPCFVNTNGSFRIQILIMAEVGRQQILNLKLLIYPQQTLNGIKILKDFVEWQEHGKMNGMFQ